MIPQSSSGACTERTSRLSPPTCIIVRCCSPCAPARCGCSGLVWFYGQSESRDAFSSNNCRPFLSRGGQPITSPKRPSSLPHCTSLFRARHGPPIRTKPTTGSRLSLRISPWTSQSVREPALACFRGPFRTPSAPRAIDGPARRHGTTQTRLMRILPQTTPSRSSGESHGFHLMQQNVSGCTSGLARWA